MRRGGEGEGGLGDRSERGWGGEGWGTGVAGGGKGRGGREKAGRMGWDGGYKIPAMTETEAEQRRVTRDPSGNSEKCAAADTAILRQ